MTDRVYTYDVLVVGAGNAACAAALAAQDQKAKVGVLEKAPQHDAGGNSTLTLQMRFAFEGFKAVRPLVKNMNDADLMAFLEKVPQPTEQDLWDEMMRTTDNMTDQEMLQVHVTESLNTVQWLASKGHDWVPSQLVSDSILSMNGGGYGLQQRNFRILEERGATFHYETSAVDLITGDNGRVMGARALAPSGGATFRAKSVVLACGGFEANAEMRARYLGPGWDTVRVRGVPYNTGDGLRMALNIGAMPHGSWTTCHAAPNDIAMPCFTGPSTYAMGASNDWVRFMYNLAIMVNKLGERFVDEASDIRTHTHPKIGRAILAQPGGVAFQIMDAKIRKMNLYHSNYDKATTAKAATLEKLAHELEIDANNFVRTVREFNAAVQPGNYTPRQKLDGKGTAGLTIPKSNYAMTIDEPPFEAWPVSCGISFTYGGLKINPRTGQVQHVAGRPVAGLYAAGEMVGGLFVGNYAAGSGMMSGATFGRMAGNGAGKAAMQAS